MATARSNTLIQSVERSLKILDALAQGGEVGFTLGEVSKLVGIRSSTAHHLLGTLVAGQVAEQDAISKRYRLGIHLIELGHSAMASTTVARIAGRPVEQLWEATGQSSSMLVFHGLVRTKILGTSSQQMLSAKPAPLDISTLHATGSGKLLLAFLPERELKDFLSRARLERYTASTVTDPARLIDELHRSRVQRYAMDREEYGLGVSCVSAAIQDASQRVIGCLDLVFPIYSSTTEMVADWTRRTCEAARALSEQFRDIGLKFQ